MNRTLKTALTLCLAAALTSGVLAQGQQGFVPGPGQLLFIPDVKKEVKISDEQMGKLKESLDKVSAKYKDDFTKFAQKQPSPEEAQKVIKGLSADSYEAIKGVLDAKQFQRFKQIEWQLSGSGALLDPQLQKELKMSDEQKKKLDDILENMNKKVQEMIQKKETSQEKYQAVGKDAEEKMNGVLTEEQQKSLKELKGPKFELSAPAPPPQPKKQ